MLMSVTIPYTQTAGTDFIDPNIERVVSIMIIREGSDAEPPVDRSEDE